VVSLQGLRVLQSKQEGCLAGSVQADHRTVRTPHGRSAQRPLQSKRARMGRLGGTDIWKPAEVTRLLRKRGGVATALSLSPPLQHPPRSLPLRLLPAAPMRDEVACRCSSEGRGGMMEPLGRTPSLSALCHLTAAPVEARAARRAKV